MSKYAEIDPVLLQNAAAAIGACHAIGNPVASHSSEEWREIAHLAIRRLRSFEKRGLANRDHATQVRDIAKYLVEQFEEDPKLVGAEIKDYEELAERVLEVVATAERNNFPTT